jgi:hypothetical protein
MRLPVATGGCYARRVWIRPPFRDRKYLRTNFPSRPASGPPQTRHVTSRNIVSGPASTFKTSHSARQVGQVNLSMDGASPKPCEGSMHTFRDSRSSSVSELRGSRNDAPGVAGRAYVTSLTSSASTPKVALTCLRRIRKRQASATSSVLAGAFQFVGQLVGRPKPEPKSLRARQAWRS